MTARPLDLDFVRSFFPALGTGPAFMENAGGSMVPETVVRRVAGYMRECQVQPGTNAAIARDASARIQRGQMTVAAMLNADDDEVVIGPSTTRNAMTLAAALKHSLAPGDEIVVTDLDHEANNGVWRTLAKEAGATLREWRLAPETGGLDAAGLAALLSERTRLVCFCHASNITGAVNPVAELAAMAHEAGALVCVDGVAAAPHGAIDVKALGVDVYFFSLYKTFGPHLGAMYVRRELLRRARGQYFYFHGEDDLPLKLNPGAPNHELTAGAAGIGDYFEALAAHHLDAPAASLGGRMGQVFALAGRHEQALAARFLDFAASCRRLRLLGPGQGSNRPRAPTFSFTIDGIAAGAVPALLEARGVVANAGDFYAPRALQALGIPPGEGVVRCSLVHYNSLDEVERLARALDGIVSGRASAGRSVA